jgi:predicted 3-demethylubiquinone-9 3-methyltransferase (glyoxalase superfamily)
LIVNAYQEVHRGNNQNTQLYSPMLPNTTINNPPKGSNAFNIVNYRTTVNKTNVQKITPFLWFNNNAEEAAKFYTSIFKNAKITDTTHYGKSAADASGRPKGTVMSVTFELEGQLFMALNGGPVFNFSPAISFFVTCETQEEVDELWKRLSEGGEEEQCGWLKDKFGISWQIVPNDLSEMLQDKDARKSERVMEALLQMKKIDIHRLKTAHEEQ